MNIRKPFPHLLAGQPGQYRILLLAPLVGVMGALVTACFRLCLQAAQVMLVGHSGSFVGMAESLPWYGRLLLPCAGGALAGLFLMWTSRLSAEKPVEYMEAVAIEDGHIAVRPTLLRSVSSLCTIASGGAIGREGAMVQLAAMAASALGGVLRLETRQLRLLVACGAAAGVTAAYNAPIAGAFFVAEIVLGAIVMDSFGPVVIACVVSNVTMRALPGYRPVYEMPVLATVSNLEVFLFIVLGLLAGLLAPQFLKLIAMVRTAFLKAALPLPFQLALGGLLIGLLSVKVPEVWGNGYSVVNSLLHEPWLWSSVVLVLVFKLAATAVTAGSGAVGGVFTPMLFLGAVVGNLFAQGVHMAAPGLPHEFAAYSIVGMGAFLAAATGAPLMAIFMIFEMTLSYQTMLPLTLACMVAFFTVKGLDAVAMYDIVVKRRRHEKQLLRLRATQMADLIQPAVTVLPLDAPFASVAAMLLQHSVKHIYVVDGQQRFLGVVRAQDVTASLMAQPPERGLLAQDLLRAGALEPLLPSMSLDAALARFLAHQGERLPIVESLENPVLLGAIHKSALLDAYSHLHGMDLSLPASR